MEYPMVVDGLAVAAGLRRAVTVPYDGSEFGTVFEATPEVVERAVASASRAAGIMREMTREERSAILRKAHARLLDDREGMAVTIASESGKPLKEARGEVDRAAWTLLFSSEEAHRLTGEVVPMDASPAGKGYLAMTVREPIGVIAAITPFNFPLNLPMHKIGPALAAGNAVVHKPASTTPICALRMARLFQECGLPPGALNVITGPGASIGEMLAMDPRVAMITFTGSAEVGLRLRSLAGMKKVTLELGNNSAVIIESDADLAQAVPRCVTGSFAHSGQVCISIQRIFVHQSLRSQFLDQFSSLTEKLVIGDPRAPETDVSSLITVGEAERVESWIQEAAQAGAHVVAGGERTRATVRPAVVTDVPDTARL